MEVWGVAPPTSPPTHPHLPYTCLQTPITNHSTPPSPPATEGSPAQPAASPPRRPKTRGASRRRCTAARTTAPTPRVPACPRLPRTPGRREGLAGRLEGREGEGGAGELRLVGCAAVGARSCAAAGCLPSTRLRRAHAALTVVEQAGDAAVGHPRHAAVERRRRVEAPPRHQLSLHGSLKQPRQQLCLSCTRGLGGRRASVCCRRGRRRRLDRTAARDAADAQPEDQDAAHQQGGCKRPAAHHLRRRMHGPPHAGARQQQIDIIVQASLLTTCRRGGVRRQGWSPANLRCLVSRVDASGPPCPPVLPALLLAGGRARSHLRAWLTACGPPFGRPHSTWPRAAPCTKAGRSDLRRDGADVRDFCTDQRLARL